MASDIKTEEQFEQVKAEGRPIIFEKGISIAPEDVAVIDVDEALSIAERELGTDQISLKQTREVYIAAIDRKRGEELPGEMPIAIDKRTGEVKVVLLPSEEGFKIMRGARRVRIK